MRGRCVNRLQTVSFSSGLVRGVHARVGAAAFSHARGHLRVSRVLLEERLLVV